MAVLVFPSGRRSAKFLSQLVLLLILLDVLVCVTAIAVGLVTPGFTRLFDLALYGVVVLLLAGLYWLNRRGQFTLAAYGVISLITTAILLIGLPYYPPDRVQWLDYLVIPIILSTILFPMRTAAAAALVILASTFSLPVFIPGFDWLTLLFGPLTFNGVVAALLLAMQHLMQTLESDRRAQLVASEERLRQSEQNYRQLVELSPAPTIIYDGATIRFANPAAVELLGAVCASDIVGKTARDFVHPDYVALAEQQIKAALRQQDFRGAERKLLRLDGGVVDVEAAGNPVLFDSSPAVQVVYKNITLHTQRTAAERSRRLSAELLRDTAAALNSTLVLEEVLQRILRYATLILPHDAARIMLLESGVAYEVEARGYENRQLNVSALLLEVGEIPRLRHMIETGQSYVLPDVSTSPDCDDLPDWVRSHAGAPIVVGDEVIGFICLDSAAPGNFRPEQVSQLQAFSDQASSAIQNALRYEKMQQSNTLLEDYVAERTAELSRAKDNVEAILNSTSDAIVLVRSNGEIVQVNPAFTHLFGDAADVAYPQILDELVAPEAAAAFKAAFRQVVDTGQPTRLELLARRRDGGQLFTAEALLAPVATTRQPGLVVCSVRDVSEQKRVQAELLKALEHERELNELKTRFTTTVSHEFRTPLSVILSSSDILKRYHDRLSDERKQAHLTTIQTYVRHMTDMLDDMLIMARSQAVGLRFDPALVEVNSFFQQSITQFWETYETTHRVEYLTCGADGELLGDARLLHRMMSNLLSNAVKYSSPDSTVYVTIDCQPEQVRLTVRDEGIGIPPGDVEHVFEMFFRAGNAASVSGAGLGLSIVKEVVALHQGQIDLTSTPDQGTNFTITFPRRLKSDQT